MIKIIHQGKTIALEEKFPIEIIFNNKKYKLVITKNGGVQLIKI